MIIGVTGKMGAGKDTFAVYLGKKGFIHISLSDIIRQEAVARGLSLHAGFADLATSCA